MSREGDAGIQHLLKAEANAAKIIDDARKERKDKLREAQEEAKTEVDVFKSQKLSEFTKFKEEHNAGTSQVQKKLSNETDAKKQEIGTKITQNSDRVVDLLIQCVINVPHPFEQASK